MYHMVAILRVFTTATKICDDKRLPLFQCLPGENESMFWLEFAG